MWKDHRRILHIVEQEERATDAQDCQEEGYKWSTHENLH